MTSLDQNVSIIFWIIYVLGILEQSGTKSYAWKLDTIQNTLWFVPMFLVWFFEPKMSQHTQAQNTPGGKIFQYPQVVY